MAPGSREPRRRCQSHSWSCNQEMEALWKIGWGWRRCRVGVCVRVCVCVRVGASAGVGVCVRVGVGVGVGGCVFLCMCAHERLVYTDLTPPLALHRLK